MPKLPDPEPHFDRLALLQAVHAQDIGLRVTTNNAEGFKRIMYQAMREHGLRIHIYSDPIAASSFYLLKQPVAAAAAEEAEEPSSGED